MADGCLALLWLAGSFGIEYAENILIYFFVFVSVCSCAFVCCLLFCLIVHLLACFLVGLFVCPSLLYGCLSVWLSTCPLACSFVCPLLFVCLLVFCSFLLASSLSFSFFFRSVVCGLFPPFFVVVRPVGRTFEGSFIQKRSTHQEPNLQACCHPRFPAAARANRRRLASLPPTPSPSPFSRVPLFRPNPYNPSPTQYVVYILGWRGLATTL